MQEAEGQMGEAPHSHWTLSAAISMVFDHEKEA
jgi:hypothetical protein